MSQNENRRLLIVDDENEIRAGYRSILAPEKMQPLSSSRVSKKMIDPTVEPDSFELVEASNGEQALEILLSHLKEGRKFAGAFVDVRMPGKLDGLQFIQEAWKHDSELMVAVVTAYQDRSVDEIHRMFSRKFQDQWDYLNKPFSAGEIIQKARNLVSTWNRRAREKKYLQKIEEQQKILISQEKLVAVGKLARSVGHEFGNILQPLLTQLDLAQEQVRSSSIATLSVLIDEMIDSVVLGANICQDLLTFSRETATQTAHGAKQTSLEIQKTSVAAAIQRSLRLLQHEIKKRDIKLSFNIHESLCVLIEESRLIQVLINIFKNALDALHDGGTIEIQAHKSTTDVIIEIQDNGTGISPDNLKQLFQPLFSTKGDHGNGLGLTTCKHIMEENHGQITIESSKGKGTTVKLIFPVQN